MRAKKIKIDYKPEYRHFLEFIGTRNLIILGIVISIYLVSGLGNYYMGMFILEAFSPYYALHLNQGEEITVNLWNSLSNQVNVMWDMTLHNLYLRTGGLRTYITENVLPFFASHPILSFLTFSAVGYIAVFISLFIVFYLTKKFMSAIANQSDVHQNFIADNPGQDELWIFDPTKKPSDEQLRLMRKSLERTIQRAIALGGNVPKNADISIREFAHRNKESKYTYRCAVYVAGPIKGTIFDNHHETPLALDQIKKISHMMGQASTHETLPLDLVILHCKKGTKSWEVDSSIPPITAGNSLPLKTLESIMAQNKSYFIWDSRANKSKTGYGPKCFSH